MNSKSTYLAILVVAIIAFSIGYYWTEIHEEEVDEPPAQVSGLIVTAMSETQLFLVWDQNTESDLDHYNVYRSTGSGFTPGPITKIAETTDNHYSDINLTPSTTYYYRITAVDTENNEGPPSEEVSGTTEKTPDEVSEFLWTLTTIVLTVLTIMAILTIIIRKYKP